MVFLLRQLCNRHLTCSPPDSQINIPIDSNNGEREREREKKKLSKEKKRSPVTKNFKTFLQDPLCVRVWNGEVGTWQNAADISEQWYLTA